MKGNEMTKADPLDAHEMAGAYTPSSLSDVEEGEGLLLNLDGFEGPLDVLLALGRAQKVDLMHISILDLCEQYLVFIEKMRTQKIRLAADYLVMAAWLTFLKSRLLLPLDAQKAEPSGEEMAAHLAFQLERLSAMRDVGARLMKRKQLGVDFFERGMPEEVRHTYNISYEGTVLELMQAYARIRTRDNFTPYAGGREAIFSLEDAFENLKSKMRGVPDWAVLWSYIPKEWRADPFMWRSSVASTFLASLELAKQGHISLRQAEDFAPLEIKGRPAP